jgi:DNA ligase-1
MKPFKGTVDDITSLHILASPKIDGIRCIKQNGVLLSASLKPIRNRHIQELCAHCPDGYDGELVLRDHGATFEQITSAVMSTDGKPEFQWIVFDNISEPDKPYADRWFYKFFPDYSQIIVPVLTTGIFHDDLNTVRDACKNYTNRCLDAGYEGAVFRSAYARYKAGRSTPHEQGMIAVKPFQDSDAVVTGYAEELENTNEAFVNERGLTARSKDSAGLVGKGRLGSLHCVDLKTDAQFALAGFTDMEKSALWSERASLVGRVLRYKYQRLTADGAPRHPVFLSWRSSEDATHD